jgi:ribosomal protein S18 acetylase RimI-like enzyme
MPAFSLRPATEADAEAIAAIHVAGWQGAYGGIVEQAYLDSLSVAERTETWRKYMAAGDMHILVAHDAQGAAAGFASFGKLKTAPPGASPIRPPYSAEIYALYILPAFWRQGLGGQLLRAAARQLREARHKSLCLWVLEKNARGVGFYKKMGGERVGKKEIEIGPTRAREICFGWRDTVALAGDAACC